MAKLWLVDALPRNSPQTHLRNQEGPERTVGRSVYGESRPSPETNNLRGQLVELFDPAGLVTSDEFDFKGNLLRSTRRLVDTVTTGGQVQKGYKSTIDWSVPVTLMAETYVSESRFDALNRVVQMIAPHSSEPSANINVIQPSYNDANLLERVEVWLDHGTIPMAPIDPEATPPSPVGIANIDYDAKAQRKTLDYKNGVSTRYRYDPDTLRLVHQRTEDSGTERLLQDLHYSFDIGGNITHVRDSAQQTIFFANARVEPSTEYTYDATFRLIEATGREHLGQGAPSSHSYYDASRVGRAPIPHPNDGQALGRYLERYLYDQVGNITTMGHVGTDPQKPGWRRRYEYSEPSLLEPGRVSNRLSKTSVGNGNSASEIYSEAGDGDDAHGNMLKMPQLRVMQWNELDQLQMTQRQAVNPTDEDGSEHHGERTWHVYDASGERIRKVTERANGQIKDERLYLGGFEIYRRPGNRGGEGNGLVRETLHITDDTERIAMIAGPRRRAWGFRASCSLPAQQSPRLGVARARRKSEGALL